MPYVTSFERVARERGAREGFGQGLKASLRLVLTQRFGPLPEWAEARLSGAEPDDVLAWTGRVLDAADLETVFGR